MIVAGIDEAGYGPLLGPLVVSAAAFSVPGALPEELEGVPCLWRELRGAVAKKNAGSKGRLLIADSKVVHNLAEGNRLLERGVLGFLRARDGGILAGTLQDLLEGLGCTDHELEGRSGWYDTSAVKLPWLADGADLAIAGNVLAGAMGRASVRMEALRTRVFPEHVFNRMVSGTNNKASALVSITLSHLDYLQRNFADMQKWGGLLVVIDKQGGRDHYTNLLLRSFPEATLRVMKESAEESVYVMTEGSVRRTVVWFREKSESVSMATALASMLCKYVRELCMHAFNTWWGGRIEGLRPTAGYYQDGLRWLADVDAHLPRLGVTREMLCRIR